MRNHQKGFIVPLLLIIIALLLVGGGAYVFTQKNQASPAVGGNVELPQATSTEQTTTVTTQTTTSATQPSVTVLSPNEGEQWAIGDTKTILWNYNLLNTTDAGRTLVSIELWGVNNNNNYLIKGLSDYNDLVVKTGDTKRSYTLTIPAHPLGRKGGIDNSQVTEPGIYQIYIQGQYPMGQEKAGIVSGKSSSFTITN